MATLSFAAAVAGWAEKVPEAVEAVRNQSAADVVKDMQTLRSEGGRMRHDTGFLWASLMASTSAMPSINPSARPAEGSSYAFDFGQVEAVIAGASLDDTLYFGYTASYAAHREYGANGQPADGFVRLAAMNWQQIVNRNAEKVRKAFGL
ncbi:HK97 gp10 family phage protein [Shinella sp.]|uniref:HK97 gp10 family phage protein n=1 Tax=Shinella sp. TaxID=1870904 RepID=UPI0028AB0EA7|nr:HK97 gp10 family phage protein [Shinella sp.]